MNNDNASRRKLQDRVARIENPLSGYSYRQNKTQLARKMNSRGLTRPPEFADINRSICHFPLSRDSRKKADWEPDGDFVSAS
jgi:hypothetical protein